MIQTIIIDDEQDGIDTLSITLKKYCPEVSILETCTQPEAGLAAIQSLQPNLVFLDIQMPRMSGFDLLQQLSPINFEVIFVSAYDKYAIRAIKFSALDYLLKPIDVDDLVQGIKRVKQKINTYHAGYSYNSLLHNVKHQSGKISRLAVPSTEGIDFLDICEIVYCKAEGNYTFIHFVNEKPMLISRNLKDFENMLSSSGFCRVHHSYLINLQHVKKYIKGDGGYVIMTGKHHVDISRRKKDEFLNLLNKL